MLIILLYHRACAGRYGNELETLNNHFKYLKSTYPISVPSEPLVKGKLNVCISFDDATYDFYHHVYPLLKAYDLKALLAVPAAYIQEKHTLPPAERLQSLSAFSFQKTPPSHAFCSFEELKEMAESGLVKIASHGMAHVDLSGQQAPLDFELQESKRILEHHLAQDIDTFVFPYGKYNKKALKRSRAYYRYLLRIGTGINFSWRDSLHYRVSADETKDLSTLFSSIKKAGYLFKTLVRCRTL